jgi:hypothetical protein
MAMDPCPMEDCEPCARASGGVCLVHLAEIRQECAIALQERDVLEALEREVLAWADERRQELEGERWCAACGLRFGRHLRDCPRPGTGLMVYTIDDVLAANARLLAAREASSA